MCQVVSWVIFGLLIGGIARLLYPGREPMGCLLTMVLGIVGSVIGGAITHFLTGDQYEPAGYLMSILGAILLLWLAGGSGPRRSLD